MYHNRADGGFVYFDDGSYTSGAEKLEITSSNDSLMMTSLQFSNRHRIWMTVNTHDALEAIDTFNDEMQQIQRYRDQFQHRQWKKLIPQQYNYHQQKYQM